MNKPTGKSRRFRWSKRVTEGAVTYRLFRSDHTGRWHYMKLEFRLAMPRCQRAEIIRQERRALRDRVDNITLKAWGMV